MGILDRGFVTIGRVGSAPLRMHWTAPIGLLVVGGASAPGCAGLLLTLLVHEAGHAFFVRRFHLGVISIDLHGLGGACRWAGPATDVQRGVIAWGGVLAQMVLIAACELSARFNLLLGSAFLGAMLAYTTAINVVIIALNLVPIPPLDGAEAWPLLRPRNLARFWRRITLRAREAAVEREIAKPARSNVISLRKARPPSPRDLN